MAEPAPTAPDTEPLPVTARPTNGRGRSIGAVLCVVLATLLLVPAGVAYWGQRTINDGQRYVATVAPLVDDPEVQAAIATKISDAIQAQVDVDALLTDVFSGVIEDRPRLEALIGPLSGAVTGLIDSQVRNFIASDTFRDFWIAANTRAQQTLLAVLRGDDSGAVSIQGDEVVLDVSDAIEVVKERLVERGLTILDNVPVEAMRARLGTPLERRRGNGTIIAVDVEIRDDLSVDPRLTRLSIWNALKGYIGMAPRRQPGIGDILYRAEHIGGLRQRSRAVAIADLYLEPPLADFNLLAYRQAEEIAETGYHHAIVEIERWQRRKSESG